MVTFIFCSTTPVSLCLDFWEAVRITVVVTDIFVLLQTTCTARTQRDLETFKFTCHDSSTREQNTRAPQGCMFSPLLFILCTYSCSVHRFSGKGDSQTHTPSASVELRWKSWIVSGSWESASQKSVPKFLCQVLVIFNTGANQSGKHYKLEWDVHGPGQVGSTAGEQNSTAHRWDPSTETQWYAWAQCVLGHNAHCSLNTLLPSGYQNTSLSRKTIRKTLYFVFL